jgi:NAD(P)H-hydrate epimerase
VPNLVRDAAVLALPEATSVAMGAAHMLDGGSAARLLEALPAYDAVCVGPGLGDAAEFIAALFSGLRAAPLPLLVDADGLNQLAQLPDWPAQLPAQTVLTPHPGEMARLMHISLAELQGLNRIDLARKQAQAWNVVLLLKGAYTVVAAADGRVTLIPFAAPVLAVGGSGDVLSGVIATLLGQGLEPFAAALLGAYLHGLTGERAAYDRGLLAGEIADGLPAAMAQLQQR